MSKFLLDLMDLIKSFEISWNPLTFNKIVLDFMKSSEILLNFEILWNLWIYEIQQILFQIW